MRSFNNLFLILFFLYFGFNQSILATESYSTAALINISGMQRMLSQKVTKSYLFYGLGISPENTQQQLIDSVILFNQNYDILLNHCQDEEVQDLLMFVEMIKKELLPLSETPYSKANAVLMLEFSETLLEASEAVVQRIETKIKKKHYQIINVSGRQRMLTQRIAKFYIAYQAGFKNINTIQQLNKAIQEFEQALKVLMDYKQNSSKISQILQQVKQQWTVVSPFYKKVKKGDLPIVVLSSTDKIMTLMDQTTRLYVNLDHVED